MDLIWIQPSLRIWISMDKSVSFYAHICRIYFSVGCNFFFFLDRRMWKVRCIDVVIRNIFLSFAFLLQNLQFLSFFIYYIYFFLYAFLYCGYYCNFNTFASLDFFFPLGVQGIFFHLMSRWCHFSFFGFFRNRFSITYALAHIFI